MNFLQFKSQTIATIILSFFGTITNTLGMSTTLLILFMVLDYVSGVICAIIEKKLSSKVGFKGILKKIMIIVIVTVSSLMQKLLKVSSGIDIPLVNIVSIFYICNEIISILENAKKCNVPIPDIIYESVEKVKKGDKYD